MMKFLLFLIGIMCVNGQTTCQSLSYFNQQIYCPQVKNSQSQYTNAEIIGVCSACGGSIQSVYGGGTLCCPLGYSIMVNSSSSVCSCSNPLQPPVECINCGYSPPEVQPSCQPSNITLFASFSFKQWACPITWGTPTPGKLNWICGCSSYGNPCVACSIMTASILQPHIILILVLSFVV